MARRPCRKGVRVVGMNPALTLMAAGSAAAWTPASSSGLKVWLKANDAATITESGNAVSQWTDKSSNAYAFTQGTAGAKPTTNTTTQNGKNVLAFDGGDALYNSTVANWKFLHDGTPTLIGAVWNPGSAVASRALCATGANSTGRHHFSFYMVSSGTMRMSAATVAAASYVANAPSSSVTVSAANVTTHLGDFGNGTASLRSSIFANGGSALQSNALTGTPSSTNPNDGLAIGALVEAGTFYALCAGWIAELVIISGADAIEATRVSLRDYLNTEWAVY